MTDNAPERIWTIADKDARGGRQPCGLWRETEILQDSTDAIFHHKPVEYVRADLCDPLQDERVKALVEAIEEHATHTLNGEPYNPAMRKVFAALAAISKEGAQHE
jgi:hypothetical protein